MFNDRTLLAAEAAILALPAWPVWAYMLIGAGTGAVVATGYVSHAPQPVQALVSEVVRDLPPPKLQAFPTLPAQSTSGPTARPTPRPTTIPTRAPILIGTPIPIPSPAPDASPAASPFRR